ncbi:hypothetical protein BRD12_03915 [Halobacteriales archaeon SW_12_67_38]|nr:MAG: hypothetical protein BRD12_03915 [Halobacteriales archaeon SW_12_67_38]
MANRVVVMSAGLILVGLLLAGYGVTGGLGSSQCGTFIDVDRTDGRGDLPRAQFGDLSEREQQFFETALDTNGLARVSTDEPLPSAFERPTIVIYQGERYLAGAVSNDGCASPIDDIEGVPTAGGSLLLIAGIYGTVRNRFG